MNILERKPFIYTTPRTGSELLYTFLFRKLFLFHEKRYGSGGEMFEMFHRHMSIINKTPFDQIMQYYISNTAKETNPYRNHTVDQEIERRFSLLQSCPNTFFKLFSHNLLTHTDKKEYIFKTYTPIFLERRNKLDQILSFLILLRGNNAEGFSIPTHFYDKSQIKNHFEANELVASDESIAIIINSIREYLVTKQAYMDQNPNVISVYYEDHITDLHILATFLGLEIETNPGILPIKNEYPKNKLDYFKNKDRILELTQGLD